MTPAVTVHSLIGARQVEVALRCLPSLAAAAPAPVHFALHDDGSLGDGDRQRLEEHLGAPCVFVSPQAGAQQVAERLRGYPFCSRFRRENLFGPKLFDVPLLSSGRAVYADTDVLWTRPVDCPEFFQGGGAAFVVMQDLQESYAVRLSRWPLLQRKGIRLASRFCAGLMSLDPAVLDLDYVEWLLRLDAETGLFDGFRFWSEQTIYAALAARAGCAWIDPRECLVVHPTNARAATTRRAAVLHFAGFSRHFLTSYLTGPIHTTRVPQVLRTVPTPVCGTGRRLLSACRQRLWLRDHGRTETPLSLPPMVERPAVAAGFHP